jgi:hypothetical protein
MVSGLNSSLKSIWRKLRTLDSYLPSYLVVVLILFFVSVISRNTSTLFIVYAILAPLGFVFAFRHTNAYQANLKYKSDRFAKLLDQLSSYLETTPPNTTRFSSEFYNDTSFVWKPPFDPFLTGSARILNQAKLTLFSEESARSRKWLKQVEDGIPATLPIAKITRELAEDVRNRNYPGFLERLGDLFVLSIEKDDNAVLTGSQLDFISICQSIAGFLMRDESYLAGQEIEKLVLYCRYQAKTSFITRNNKWELLIAYWLLIRDQVMRNPQDLYKENSRVWASQSDVLADTVIRVTRAYDRGDFELIAALIYSSFDWERRKLKFLLN